MAKEYTASHPTVIEGFGYEPIPTIYKDSDGRTIYVTDQPITGIGQLETILLYQGIAAKGALIYNTVLEDNELE